MPGVCGKVSKVQICPKTFFPMIVVCFAATRELSQVKLCVKKRQTRSANLSFDSGLLCDRVYRNRKKWSVSRNIAEIIKMNIAYNDCLVVKEVNFLVGLKSGKLCFLYGWKPCE